MQDADRKAIFSDEQTRVFGFVESMGDAPPRADLAANRMRADIIRSGAEFTVEMLGDASGGATG